MMENISPSHRILLVEDNPEDVRLIQEYLTEAQGLRTQMECAGTLSQALEIIPAFLPDLVLLDLGLPDSEGLNGLGRIQARAPLTPVVILTGLDDHELGGQAVSQGAQDFLLKGEVNGPILRRVISYAIERMGAWRAVQESEEAVAAAAELRLLNLTLEERVRERTEELDKANRELEAFAYSVSHDLRGPLRAIDGFSGILAEEYGGVLDQEGNRLLAVVRENTGRMGRLIEDLLEFSRVGRKPMSRRPIDMEGLVRSVVEELHLWSGNGEGKGSRKGEKKGEIIIGPLPPAHGDAALLKQVWINLLANAAKFSRERETPAIRVEGQEEEGTAVYSVTDNGVGFDMAYSNKLFGVFERLHRADEFEGTGVGLALVSRIVERHGGKIWGEGAVDCGATFWFTLPHTEGEDR